MSFVRLWPSSNDGCTSVEQKGLLIKPLSRNVGLAKCRISDVREAGGIPTFVPITELNQPTKVDRRRSPRRFAMRSRSLTCFGCSEFSRSHRMPQVLAELIWLSKRMNVFQLRTPKLVAVRPAASGRSP